MIFLRFDDQLWVDNNEAIVLCYKSFAEIA